MAYDKVKPNGFLSGDDYSGDYEKFNIGKLNPDLLERDTIKLPALTHDVDGNITPNVHAGVVKAVYECFGGNVMWNLPTAKWLHWKTTEPKDFNMRAFKPGLMEQGQSLMVKDGFIRNTEGKAVAEEDYWPEKKKYKDVPAFMSGHIREDD